MNINGFLDSLSVMWQGMAGIFVVVAVIIVAVWLLGKIKTNDGEK